MLKKRFKIPIYITIGIVAITIISYTFMKTYDYVELEKSKKVTYILSDQEKQKIQDGDIILRYGHGLVSDYIVNYFNEKYKISHCGIISKENGKLQIIHSESSSMLSKEGIQTQDFDEFTDAGHLNSVIIVRFKKDKAERAKITRRAKYYLQKEIPFDYAFDASDSSTMYCSEIIWHIFLDEFQHDIFIKQGETKPDFSQFANFYDTSQFEIIINHHTRKTDF